MTDAVDGPLLRHRPFALYWFARVFSSGAFHMQAVAIGWQVYALTGSALALGFVGLAQFLPMLVLTLVVGHVADRYPRRIIVAICQGITGCAAALLTLGTAGGWLGAGGIFAVVTVVGAARAFENPTMAALVPVIVPESQLHRATAWSASANQTAQIVGPALGGLLFAIDPIVAFASASVLFLAACALSSLNRIAEAQRVREPVTLASLFSGVAYVRAHPIILGTLSLDLFVVLLGGVTGLLPIYARDILHTGPWGLGVLRSCPALGALAMSVVMAHRPLDRHVGTVLFGAVAIYGVATIVFSVSTALPLSMAALLALGAADVISVVVRFSLVQLRTPDAMRGRVSALNALFVG
ncbi:MAG TPA: MFS transporter, partial [Candidatus Sulfotelmatobacter sp.]|nr:MFS transporter [Candidatus Sulfotelmatobacter sp.]